jgi:hypothetical protein
VLLRNCIFFIYNGIKISDLNLEPPEDPVVSTVTPQWEESICKRRLICRILLRLVVLKKLVNDVEGSDGY